VASSSGRFVLLCYACYNPFSFIVIDEGSRGEQLDDELGPAVINEQTIAKCKYLQAHPA